MKLEINQLVKKFGTQKAIQIEHLSLSKCSTLALLGPSGGGKSTLLRLIAGLTLPDSGEIVINDRKLNFQEKELLEYRKHLGIVFQSYNLFPHFTALENIVLPLQQVHGMPKEQAEAISMDLLKRFQLDKHACKKPHTLSGGQVQRVALIRAIANHPQVLILDEPTSALDPMMTAEVLELILELKKEGRDLIIVTHHLHFAKKAADHVLFIADGKILEQGSPEAVFDHPKSTQAIEYMTKVLAF